MTTNQPDPMIGRLVDGRYQVRSRIARGGMATVYLATDLRLERLVAVKVMHGHLADDEQYKARFIQEARSAARLSHPSVVNVYDQGQDADTAYLVMEYLPGITLRDLLDERRVLTTDQTFDIMESVLSGLAAAHQAGIVHRDLKPENVLLANDGRIKIGDFGLARAATANTATGNALLGTIAYLSPELVTRGIADTRSDIYAVGIMLYEMLAGEQPFKGEQPFQIAHQHANDTVGAPSSKNSSVPAALDELVLWATARDPDQRPRDARVMLDQLVETREAMDAGTASVSTAATSVQRTMVLPSSINRNDQTQVLRPASRHRTGPVAGDNAAALTQTATRRRRRGLWLFALVVLLAGIAAAAGWWFGAGPGSLVSVPAVSNQSVQAATATLEAADLIVAATPRLMSDPAVPIDSVIGTDPPTGKQVPRSAEVTLLVSTGPALLPIPALAGVEESLALDAIEAAPFSSQPSTYEFSADIAEGIVIRALGSEGIDLATLPTYPEQAPVTLVVSLGSVPEVVGIPLSDAISAFADKRLVGAEGEHEYSRDIAEGSVIRVSQRIAGVVTTNSEFDFVVSDGPEPVTIPDVVGMTRSKAEAALEALGLRVAYNPLFAPFGGAQVTDTNPESGTVVDSGSTVTLFLVLAG